MRYYDLATLSLPLGAATEASAAASDYTEGGAGRLVGAWTTEFGDLNKLLLLREFDTRDALADDRHRILMAPDPFGCSHLVQALSMESFAAFPFIDPVETGAFGNVYEIRTYQLQPGGLGPTLEAWEAALPTRSTYSRCVVAMYALDGTPRFTQIWPYSDLNERSRVRAQAMTDGIWPPKGAPQWLRPEMHSWIGLPTAQSPLH